jgi:hypothetical protein
MIYSSLSVGQNWPVESTGQVLRENGNQFQINPEGMTLL